MKEEDFISNTFGVNLTAIEEEQMFSELKKMEADLTDKIAKRKGGKKGLESMPLLLSPLTTFSSAAYILSLPLRCGTTTK